MDCTNNVTVKQIDKSRVLLTIQSKRGCGSYCQGIIWCDRCSSVKEIMVMNCWHCNTELIWGGDHDLDDYEDMDYDIVTNLSCPKCESYVEVYHKIEN